ncbi:PREDICTED: acyl-coenzyme A thioesterase 2, mitochondrial [Mandrillus leucophaeus]|uniref:acyl-coenzyme A thioesterase 2, mitochondrial n=1 Tax=Mandrillus leucophaeus TaxID=9568 RepID=UPI0005F46769|nr:PREDICTED: acyl-coenzyme A thioesterase 2, mitochondrial [Mandrillus leucophaeus]
MAASPAVLRASRLYPWSLKSWAQLLRSPQMKQVGRIIRVPARMAATLILEPAGRCCWDEPVRIAVRGLAPERAATTLCRVGPGTDCGLSSWPRMVREQGAVLLPGQVAAALLQCHRQLPEEGRLKPRRRPSRSCQHTVKGPGVGLLGVSKGGELCLSMASFLKGITAAVIINGSVANVGGTLHYKGETLPPVGVNRNRIKVTKDGYADIVDVLNSPLEGPDQKSFIPVERAESTFLFLVGQDDHNWKSEFYANEACKRLQAHGRRKPQIICYAGAGHYIEPPYFPLCRASLHALVGSAIIFGGEPRAHAMAQVDAWKQLQTFFHKHLGGQEGTIPAKL